MRLLRPRSVRAQLVLGLTLLELVVLSLFVLLLLKAERSELRVRTGRRVMYQASLSAARVEAAMRSGDLGELQEIAAAARRDPGIQAIEILDAKGHVIASSGPGVDAFPGLNLRRAASSEGSLLLMPSSRISGALCVVRDHGKLDGYVAVLASQQADRDELHATLRITFFAGILALAACTWLAGLLASSIGRPLAQLLEATRQLIRNPEDRSALPIPANSGNEIGELTFAFNRLIYSVQEQRANSRETLALLDSILANAPIGFAFFDRRHHVVRVNSFLADLSDVPASRYAGKTPREAFPGQIGERLEQAVAQVLASGTPVRDLELSGEWQEPRTRSRTWLVNVYPIQTEAEEVRWVGAVIVDATERKLAEDALRKTEKLAAAGRLAASIAHEVNNPLEAVTNLLFLISTSDLNEQAATYAKMAQHEVARVSEIAQQTLRFYRQSTLPTHASLCELMDSVLVLHQGRLLTLQVTVEKNYFCDGNLFCFAGEIRQLFTNLVSNAVDSMMPGGGVLKIRIRECCSRRNEDQRGVRVTIADTGCGIPRDMLSRIFEPFFTTKDATGTGLGLWVSAEILRKHQALWQVKSRTAEETTSGPTGTVFTTFFPYLTPSRPGERAGAPAVTV